MTARRLVGDYGSIYDGAIDLDGLRRAHVPLHFERTRLSVDGNVAAAIPFLQWWRAPIVAGFPITPATKWLEHIAAEVAGKQRGAKRVKLVESEHAAADYVSGVAAACRGLIVGTATSSVGLDHMTESVRSLGASGLGNVILVNVCRATANYPLCIEGDPSDMLAHRDSGFIQVMCRGKQQIYDTLLQLPAIGMHPSVLTPTMPGFYGIKDSHRAGVLEVEPDEEVNAFLDRELVGDHGSGELGPRSDFLDVIHLRDQTLPGLLDGDTSMGSCVTSAWYQGFKIAQKVRLQSVLDVLPEVGHRFEKRFGRPGIELFERHGMDDRPEVAIVCMGPDAGTAVHMLGRLREELRTRIGLVVVRLLSPFPTRAIAEALTGVHAVGVVNNAHHHGRGHLTLDVADALAARVRFIDLNGRVPPIESFFCGLGGADVSTETWRAIAVATCEAARRGGASRRWHFLHEGLEVGE